MQLLVFINWNINQVLCFLQTFSYKKLYAFDFLVCYVGFYSVFADIFGFCGKNNTVFV
jgi:hypothetical protein